MSEPTEKYLGGVVPITDPAEIEDGHEVPLTRGNDKRSAAVPVFVGAVTGDRPFVSPPPVADWTWVNQESATLVQRGRSIVLTCPAAGAIDVRAVYRPIPGGGSSPWTLIAAFKPDNFNINFAYIGLSLIKDNGEGGGPMLQFVERNDSGLYVYDQSSVTASASTLHLDNFLPGRRTSFNWLRVQYTGTHYTFGWSFNGYDWRQGLSVARSSTLLSSSPADRVGIMADSLNNLDVRLALIGWELAEGVV